MARELGPVLTTGGDSVWELPAIFPPVCVEEEGKASEELPSVSVTHLCAL